VGAAGAELLWKCRPSVKKPKQRYVHLQVLIWYLTPGYQILDVCLTVLTYNYYDKSLNKQIIVDSGKHTRTKVNLVYC